MSCCIRMGLSGWVLLRGWQRGSALGVYEYATARGPSASGCQAPPPTFYALLDGHCGPPDHAPAKTCEATVDNLMALDWLAVPRSWQRGSAEGCSEHFSLQPMRVWWRCRSGNGPEQAMRGLLGAVR